MSGHSADYDAQRREHEAFVAECETKGVCWASGLRIASCMTSICDCFRETHPDSPYDLHPEDFIVGRVTPPASTDATGGAE